jgi:hypothetical protein
VSSCTAVALQPSPPASNDDTPAASGARSANTRRLPFTSKAAPSQAMSRIGLTPGGVLRNCIGGLTWNGRSASTSRSASGAFVRLVSSYWATRPDWLGVPRANAVVRKVHAGACQVTLGIGR